MLQNGKKYEMKFSWYDYIKYLPMAVIHAIKERFIIYCFLDV